MKLVRSPVEPDTFLLNAAIKNKIDYLLSNDVFKL